MKKSKFLSVILYVAIMALIFSWVLGLFDSSDGEIPYSEIVHLFQTEQVRSFTVEGEYIELELYSPYEGDMVLGSVLADPEVFRQQMELLFQEQ